MLVLIVIVVAVLVYCGRVDRRKTRQHWQRAARRLGLTCLQRGARGTPRLHGHFRHYDVDVEVVHRQHGEHREAYTQFEVHFSPLGLGLKLTRQGAFSGVRRLFGGQDIEVGDPDFDDQVIVQADRVGTVRKFLTPWRRVAAQRFLASYSGARIEDDRIWYEAKGKLNSATRLESIVHRMVSVADAFLDDEGAKFYDEAIEAFADGETDRGLAALRVARPRHGAPQLHKQLLEDEVLASAGQWTQAGAAAAAITSDLPDDPELNGWRERIERHAATPPPLPAGVATSPPPLPPQPSLPAPESKSGVDIQELSKHLFGEGRMSFETDRLFEENYAGQTIRWTGEVRRSGTYSRDLHFGEGPGVRAVLTLANLGEEGFLTRNVSAIVAFPEETREQLAAGSGVTFTGRLIHCDPFQRNLFVAEAELIG